ncbi:hypothetical protein JZ751_002198 [Albula glossodonta]|uniref:Uncharacterized protein n=1 Tax=Albula glossodonta TaxID=121402 RepID=A0A8T2P4Q1_9TELE|nr:hypothetical protein JZ751_002198 [Albula glossodonta]
MECREMETPCLLGVEGWGFGCEEERGDKRKDGKGGVWKGMGGFEPQQQQRTQRGEQYRRQGAATWRRQLCRLQMSASE